MRLRIGAARSSSDAIAPSRASPQRVARAAVIGLRALSCNFQCRVTGFVQRHLQNRDIGFGFDPFRRGSFRTVICEEKLSSVSLGPS